MPLSKSVEPLLNIQLTTLLDHVNHIWPQIELKSSKLESKSQNTLKKIFDCDLDSIAAKSKCEIIILLLVIFINRLRRNISPTSVDNWAGRKWPDSISPCFIG